MDCYEKLTAAAEFIRSRTDFVPEIAITLGSGLGGLADMIDETASVSYGDIPNFPVSTVAGHNGKLIFGYLSGKRVVAMQGRVHYYEGYTMEEVVMPTRLCRLLGASTLILSNAAGGLDLSFEVGDIMIIADHISSFVPSPLIGKNIDALGVRFPDVSEVYKKELIEKLEAAAKKLEIPLKKGVYLQVTGPNYETPAEISMMRALGGGAVGMSTAVEAIAAAHAGMKVLGVSLITDVPGKDVGPLTHEEVTRVANEATEKLSRLISETVKNM